MRTFYQSHSCEGFTAKVTIEWDIPDTTDETVIARRMEAAEDIADSILGFAGKKMLAMVDAMRGITKRAKKPDYMLRGGPGRDYPCADKTMVECALSECQEMQRCKNMF